MAHVLVAQLDRVLASEARGQEFESPQARHQSQQGGMDCRLFLLDNAHRTVIPFYSAAIIE